MLQSCLNFFKAVSCTVKNLALMHCQSKKVDLFANKATKVVGNGRMK